MMDKAFEGERLQASFTFRVMEAIKRVKIKLSSKLWPSQISQASAEPVI